MGDGLVRHVLALDAAGGDRRDAVARRVSGDRRTAREVHGRRRAVLQEVSMNKTKRTVYYDIIETAIGSVLVAGDGKILVATKFNVDERALTSAVEALHRELHGAFELVR